MPYSSRIWLVAWLVCACSSPAGTNTGGTAGGPDVKGPVFDVATSFDSKNTADVAAASVDVAVPDAELSDAAWPDATPADPGDAFAANGDVVSADIGPEIAAGAFGAPCTQNPDCAVGFCVQSPAGMVCTKTCIDSCPADWQCVTPSMPAGDVISLCVPRFTHLCDPCGNGLDCNLFGLSVNVCVPHGPNGSFCAASCDPASAGTCPKDFACESVTSQATGKASWQCMRKTGECACSALAIESAAKTTCSSTNGFGTCSGERACKSGMLSECSAMVAGEEVCNGQDDDCNGKTDDLSGQPDCTNKNETGLCKGKVTGCEAGKALCNAKVPATEVCNGQDDDCDGQTDEDLCEDGAPCTQGACNLDGSCKQLPLGGVACDDGSLCTAKDVCVQGVCQGSANLGCDDSNPCTSDSCDPVQGCTHAAQDGPCADDGNACTLDQCKNQQCSHVAAPSGSACSDDGNPCTTDVCAGNVCGHPPSSVGSACPDEGDSCTVDTCDGKGACGHALKAGTCAIQGVCVGSGSAQPGNACFVCDPGANPKGWTAASGLPCNDGDGCTTSDLCLAGTCKGKTKDCSGLNDACNSGICQGDQCVSVAKPSTTGCNDQDACTSGDHCSSGKCLGTAVNCTVVADACNDGVCAAGACLKKAKANGLTCTDNDACTLTDSCQTGVCKGKAKDCSGSSDPCNDGVCSAGTCGKKAKANGTICNDNSTCTSSDACANGVCAGNVIKDSSEPNNSQPGKALENKTDCQNFSSLTASLSPLGDVDWYSYDAADKSLCTVKPNVTLAPLAADYDVCMYFQCHSGNVKTDTVTCDSGTKVSGGPNGAWGCCSTNSGTSSDFTKISPHCTFLGSGDDGGTVWIKVQGKGAPMCGGYTLQWSAKG